MTTIFGISSKTWSKWLYLSIWHVWWLSHYHIWNQLKNRIQMIYNTCILSVWHIWWLSNCHIWNQLERLQERLQKVITRNNTKRLQKTTKKQLQKTLQRTLQKRLQKTITKDYKKQLEKTLQKMTTKDYKKHATKKDYKKKKRLRFSKGVRCRKKISARTKMRFRQFPENLKLRLNKEKSITLWLTWKIENWKQFWKLKNEEILMVYSDFFILEQFPRLTKVCDFWRIVLAICKAIPGKLETQLK